MSFRKEKKYRLTPSDQKKVKRILVEERMQKSFPSRTINSVYFDTGFLDMFEHSQEGVLPRKKVRLRWYDKSRSFYKETKISSIEGRYKLSEPFISSDFLHNFDITLLDIDYGPLKPILMVSYYREYFLFNNLRITFDTNICYTDITSLNQKSCFDQECVMETKASIYTSDDYIESIINYPTSRFSKYARGLLKINDEL